MPNSNTVLPTSGRVTTTTTASNHGSSSPRLLLSLVALAGVASCFVFGEWQILSPFSRFLSTSAGSMDKAASNYMPSKLLKTVSTATLKTVLPNTSNDDDDNVNVMMVSKTQGDEEDTGVVSKPRKITKLVLLGERHSGTTYTTSMLTSCFPNLQVSNVLVRYKHWFQPTPDYVVNATRTFLKDVSPQEMEQHDLPSEWPEITSNQSPKDYFEDTLVVVMVRNPYDWLEAIREGPHHWPNHLTLFRFPDGPREDQHGNGRVHEYGVRLKEWRDFTQANMSLSNNVGNATQLCQHGFMYHQVSPCRRSKELYPDEVLEDYASDIAAAPDYLNFNADKPLYELDESTGKPYQHALEFRTAKLQNFLEIPTHWNVGGFVTFQHEQVNEEGAHVLLEAISELVGHEATCQADPPKHQEHKQMNEEWEQWITEHANWDVEGSLGYKPRETQNEMKVEATVSNVKEPKAEETEEVSKMEKTSSNVIADEQPGGFDRIVLLGERHSGTTYTTRTLEKCFPDIEVSDFLVRFKHWFQPTPEYVAETTKQYLKNDMTDDEGEDMFEIHNQWPNIAALNNPKTAFKRTLLIVMFRNPYDWLEAMRVGPHHWNNHFSLYRFPRAPVPETTGNPWYGSNFSTWSDFVHAEMTYNVDDGSDGTDLCQNGFMKGQVTPCLKSKSIYPKEVKKDYPDNINEAPDQLPFNAHHPIYEMDPDGNPYADPLAFRSAKIQNFLDIPNHWDLGSFMVLQHEDVNEKGSAFLLEEVSKILGQEPICEADPPKHQPSKILNPDWAKYITKNLDWETESQVGYEPRVDKSKEADKAVASPGKVEPSFQRIVLLGERHSGTSYTTKMLKKCFPKLNVDDFFGRYKHWFQPTPEYMLNATKTFLQNPDTHEEALTFKLQHQWPELMAGTDDPKAAFKNTLLIVMFRNAYDWLEAMREGPHHWPNHFDTIRIKKGVYEIKSYDWNKFVSSDMKIPGDESASAPLCQIGFPAGSVSPCLKSRDQYPSVVKEDYADDMSKAPDSLPFNSHNPIYEMDENGKPFTHPLELRAAKIKHFLDLPNHWDLGGFIQLQHEEVNLKGSAFLLEQVSKIVGMKPECQADPPMKQEHKELESDWSDWITKHADWKTEKEAGYEPRVSSNSRQKSL